MLLEKLDGNQIQDGCRNGLISVKKTLNFVGVSFKYGYYVTIAYAADFTVSVIAYRTQFQIIVVKNFFSDIVSYCGDI
jgi:hypothetical protein